VVAVQAPGVAAGPTSPERLQACRANAVDAIATLRERTDSVLAEVELPQLPRALHAALDAPNVLIESTKALKSSAQSHAERRTKRAACDRIWLAATSASSRN
jgi:hypothetical protein